jgi:tRNA1(Val) A37 N6-methylase TrmN6
MAHKTYVKNLFKYYKNTKSKYTKIKIWFRLFNLYFGAINIFKPIIAMEIYCKYKPNSVLDFTMGWGGRLVGACALNVPNYIGIDLNQNLKKPYEDMVKTLKEHSTTNISLYFKDALTIDYSKLKYDLVLTSPPYYNIEKYEGQKDRNIEEWNKDFYEPLFTKTWKNLQKGGFYCLNIPEIILDTVAIKILGKPNEYIPLYKNKRTQAEKYKEYIYVWYK